MIKHINKALVLLIMVSLVTALTSCKKDEKPNVSETAKARVISEPFRMCCGNGFIMADMKASDALSLAGDYRDYVEVESCAHDGMDKIYIYSGYEIYVNEYSGVEKVSRIILKDDSSMLDTGIYIGCGIDAVFEAYGNGSVNEGYIIYKGVKDRIEFGVKDNRVISISIILD